MGPVRAISTEIGRINAEKLNLRIGHHRWPSELFNVDPLLLRWGLSNLIKMHNKFIDGVILSVTDIRGRVFHQNICRTSLIDSIAVTLRAAQVKARV